MDERNETSGQSVRVKLEAIYIRKDALFTNARSTFPEEPLSSLRKSIQDIGLLKPLTIERKKEKPSEFWLIAGERRYLALTALKNQNCSCYCNKTQKFIPAQTLYQYIDVNVVAPATDADRLKIMIAENAEHSQVTDWDYFQYALRLEAEKDIEGKPRWSRKDLCNIFSASPTWMSHTFSLAKLPKEVMQCFKEGTLPRNAAIQLLSAKEDKVNIALQYARDIVVKKALREKANAQEEANEASLEVELANIGVKKAEEIGDSIQSKVYAKRGQEATKKLLGARHREEKANNVIKKPTITDEAVKETYEKLPELMKEGVAPKARSPKKMKSKIADIKNLLESCTGDLIVNSSTGKSYHYHDVRLILAAYEQWLGKRPLDIFTLLDEEYANRSDESKKVA